MDEYLGFWRAEIGQARQVKRAEWDDYWAWLIEHDVVRPDGRTEFRRHFDDTQRQHATPRLGLRLQFARARMRDLDLP